MSLDQLTRAAAHADKWTATRNDLIRQARADGVALRTIAKAAGLSHTAVAKICAHHGSTS